MDDMGNGGAFHGDESIPCYKIKNHLPTSSRRDLLIPPKWRSRFLALKRSRLWVQTRSRLEEPEKNTFQVSKLPNLGVVSHAI